MTRVLLISDIHFGKDSRSLDFVLEDQRISPLITSRVSMYDSLVNTTKCLGPEYIFCAGDLTSCGKPLEFKACLDKLYGLADAIGVDRRNVIYCVGNHDVDELITNLDSTSNQYEGLSREFTKEEKNYLKEYYCKLSHSWLHNENYIIDNMPYRNLFSEVGPVPMSGFVKREQMNIFVLNSAFLRTDEQKAKHGILTQAQLDWLEKSLADNAQDEVWNVVLLHHHPFAYNYPEIYHETGTLEEGPQLQKICSEFPGTIVLHGHYHFPAAFTQYTTDWKNPVTFISSGSLSVNSGGRLDNLIENTFHIAEFITFPNLIKLDTYSFSLNDGWRKSIENEYNTIGAIRYLGSMPLSKSELTEALRQLPQNIDIRFEDLADQIKYTKISEINDSLTDIYGKQLSGTFPGTIRIHTV